MELGPQFYLVQFEFKADEFCQDGGECRQHDHTRYVQDQPFLMVFKQLRIGQHFMLTTIHANVLFLIIFDSIALNKQYINIDL